MTVGTRSVLFGVHNIFIHPLCVLGSPGGNCMDRRSIPGYGLRFWSMTSSI
jgi:hypothetical protein